MQHGIRSKEPVSLLSRRVNKTRWKRNSSSTTSKWTPQWHTDISAGFYHADIIVLISYRFAHHSIQSRQKKCAQTIRIEIAWAAVHPFNNLARFHRLLAFVWLGIGSIAWWRQKQIHCFELIAKLKKRAALCVCVSIEEQRRRPFVIVFVFARLISILGRHGVNDVFSSFLDMPTLCNIEKVSQSMSDQHRRERERIRASRRPSNWLPCNCYDKRARERKKSKDFPLR